MRIFVIFLFLVTLQAAATAGESKTMKENVTHSDVNKDIPTKLEIYIGGFLGPSYQVELKNTQLIYTAYEQGRQNPKKIFISPTSAQWKEFRKEIDKINIWHWTGDYMNNNANDGTQWAINIAYENKALTINGSNSFPDYDAKSIHTESTKAFDQYLAAVEKIIGREFR